MKKLIAVLLLLTGCAAKIPATLNLHLNDRFTKHESQAIVDGVHDGYNYLLNCEYLQTKYPDQYTELIMLREGIQVSFISKSALDKYFENGEKVCARAFLHGTGIEINPYLFNKKGCEMWDTMAHEILHLIGFSHTDRDSDGPLCKEFMNIMWKCTGSTW